MRHPRFIRHLSCALATLIVAVAASAQEPREIRWQWKPGQTLIYRMTQTTDQVVNVAGQEMNTISETEMLMRQVVDNVDEDGIATVTVTYDRMKFKMDNPMMKVEYDSARPGDDEDQLGFVKSFSAFVGRSFSFTVNTRGEVQAVQGMSTILDAMFDGMGDDPQTRQFMDQFKKTMNDDAMKGMLSMNMDVLPDDAVTRGQSWTTEVEQPLPMLGTMQGETKHAVAEFATVWGHEVVRLTMDSTFTVQPPVDEEGQPALPYTMEFDRTKMNGEIIFAIDVGYVLRSEMTMEMDGNIKVERGPEMDPMNMEMEMEQKTVLELVDARG